MYLMPKDFSKQTIKEFIGHKDEVNCVSYSPDFQFMVTGCDDHRIRIFNVKSKQCLIKLRGHTGAVKCVAVSQCSRFIASGSFDKSARIWKTANGECLHTLTGHSKSVDSIAFSPGAVYLCTGSWDRTAILWCIETGIMLQTFQGHTALVQSVAFSYDSHMMASGSWDFSVRVWSLHHKTYKQIREDAIKTFESQQNVNIVIDGKPSDKGNCKSEIDNAEEINPKFIELIGHTGNVHSVSFSLIGMLASGSWDRTIRLWNPCKGLCLRILEGHIGWVQAINFSPDSTYIASVADDDFVKVWDILSGNCVKTFEGDTDLAQFCAFTPNGELIASGAAVLPEKQLPKNKNEEEIKETKDKLIALLN